MKLFLNLSNYQHNLSQYLKANLCLNSHSTFMASRKVGQSSSVLRSITDREHFRPYPTLLLMPKRSEITSSSLSIFLLIELSNYIALMQHDNKSSGYWGTVSLVK